MHVCILPRCGMWAYEFLITVCVWERQYSGCSLSPVAPHPSGHKTPWQSVTSTLLFPPQRAMSVTEWSAPWMWNDGIPQSCLSSPIHHSHPHSWIFSLVLSLAHVVRLLKCSLNPRSPSPRKVGPQINLHSLPIQMLHQHRWIYIALTHPGAKSPLCLPPRRGHTRAGRSQWPQSTGLC